MLKPVLLFLFISVLSCNSDQKSDVPKSPSNLPKIALLGTFHFGATNDFSSMITDDLLSLKRQQEIEALIETLYNFQPTKIMLECTLNDEEAFQKAFDEYRNNLYELKLDEREQLGFRLAKRLNHNTIYCVDYKLQLPFTALSEFAKEHKNKAFQDFLSTIKNNDKKDSEYLKTVSLLEYFSYKNTTIQDLKNKNQYLNDTAKFVSDSTYIGIDFVSKWWSRNFYIMSNIDSHISANDRVLVIIGGAHRAIIKDFYEDRNDVEYIEINTYLKK